VKLEYINRIGCNAGDGDFFKYHHLVATAILPGNIADDSKNQGLYMGLCRNPNHVLRLILRTNDCADSMFDDVHRDARRTNLRPCQYIVIVASRLDDHIEANADV
jgi:hypothetical protein